MALPLRMDTTLEELLRAQVEANGERPALRTRATGQWITRTWREWDETSLLVASALVGLGVRTGDRVALASSTRREWAEIDLGIMRAGAITVPLDTHGSPEAARHVLSDSESAVVFAEDPTQLERLFHPTVTPALRNVRRIIYIDALRRLHRPDDRGRLEVRLADVVPREARANVMPFADWLEAGRRVLDREETRVRARSAALRPDDLATLVYTSGASGPPRGVCLSHGNLAFETQSLADVLKLTSHDEQLLFLPLAHIFGRLLLTGALRVGYATAFATSPSLALSEMNDVHPTFFGAVPQFYESVYREIRATVSAQRPWKRRGIDAAFEVGAAYSEATRMHRKPGARLALEHRLADVTVLEAIRHRFGRRLRFALSGGAALSEKVAAWFHACGIRLLEGYGLTETTGATHLQRPDGVRFGTVGPPLPGVDARIGEGGEVLVRGRNVMRGYLHPSDDGPTRIDAHGWLHTGDLGTIDALGFLSLLGRKKDMIVTSTGNTVAPEQLEDALRQSPWISQAAVSGDGKPYVVALLTLNAQTARQWARDRGADLSWSEIIRHPDVRHAVEDAVNAVNGTLAPNLHIRRWTLLDHEFSVEHEDLTVSAKLRRPVVMARHRATIDAMYDAGSG